jgi:hypothetical protein
MKTARIQFDAPRKRRNALDAGPALRCRTLAVERLSYNLERGNSATCPFIRLKGRWLARAGFAAGSRVVVTVRRGCLVIRLLAGARS